MLGRTKTSFGLRLPWPNPLGSAWRRHSICLAEAWAPASRCSGGGSGCSLPVGQPVSRVRFLQLPLCSCFSTVLPALFPLLSRISACLSTPGRTAGAVWTSVSCTAAWKLPCGRQQGPCWDLLLRVSRLLRSPAQCCLQSSVSTVSYALSRFYDIPSESL